MKKFFYIMIILILFYSCVQPGQRDFSIIKANIEVDNALSDLFEIFNTTLLDYHGLKHKDCYDIETKLTSELTTIIFTFTGTCYDSIARSGKIIISFNPKIQTDTFFANVQYDNYKRANYTCSGEITLKAYKDTNNINYILNFYLDRFTIKLNDSLVYYFSGNESFNIKLQDTKLCKTQDMSYYINSKINGTEQNGLIFTTISDNLLVKPQCQFYFPIQGKKIIEFTNGENYLIDYGQGTCDFAYNVYTHNEEYAFLWEE